MMMLLCWRRESGVCWLDNIHYYYPFAMAMVDEDEDLVFWVFFCMTELHPTVGKQAPARHVLRKQANLVSRKRGEMALLVPRHIFELPAILSSSFLPYLLCVTLTRGTSVVARW